MYKCTFYIIKYVPNIFRQEFVNIGIIFTVMSPGDPIVSVRFTKNWSRVLCLDPDADTEMLEDLEQDLVDTISTSTLSADEAIERLQDQMSNNIQLEKGLGATSIKGLLTEDPRPEMDRLMRLYVEPLKEQDSELSSGPV